MKMLLRGRVGETFETQGLYASVRIAYGPCEYRLLEQYIDTGGVLKRAVLFINCLQLFLQFSNFAAACLR